MGPPGARTDNVLAERSSFLGRGRVFEEDIVGEDGGSFLTIIFGADMLNKSVRYAEHLNKTWIASVLCSIGK